MGNADDCIGQWSSRRTDYILGQSKSTLNRVLYPFVLNQIIIVILAEGIAALSNDIIIVIVVAHSRSCRAQRHRSSPELDLVEQLHVGYPVRAIAGRVNKRIDDARRPAHDRGEDVHEWHLDFVVKHICEHEGQEAEQEAHEDGQHHSGQSRIFPFPLRCLGSGPRILPSGLLRILWLL